MLISCGQNREWQKIYSTALTCCHQANMLTTAELQQHHLDAWDCFHPSAPKIWIALVIVTVNMSRDLRHHGEPAASLQHGPPREPQWVCAPRRRQTPNSHQTSPYSDSCCNWGKSATVWMDFSFKISALPVSVLVTLLKSQQHMYYSRIAKTQMYLSFSWPWWSFSCTFTFTLRAFNRRCCPKVTYNKYISHNRKPVEVTEDGGVTLENLGRL